MNLFWAIPGKLCGLCPDWKYLGGEFSPKYRVLCAALDRFAAVQGILLAVNFYLPCLIRPSAPGSRLPPWLAGCRSPFPPLLAFLLYGDSLTLVKIAGLCAALLALYLCTAPEKNSSARTVRLFQLMPILVFITFGCYFSILKYLQANYLDGSSYHAYVMSGFIFAFASSIVIGVSRRVFSPGDFRMKHIYAGIFLGGINYVAVYALLEVLALRVGRAPQLFPIYSVGAWSPSARFSRC